ncbi:MAG: DUF1273 domain-containing protein [Oscillospiraceae bacterium]|jgi:uncharacterized phage-like protein YoqJ|nr:DUF1273 domain-containing protein [Oscillospiraceae bacterium]
MICIINNIENAPVYDDFQDSLEKIEIPRACCFTGSRDLSGGNREEIKSNLEYAINNMISRKQVRDFLCGGAYGFDLLAGHAAAEIKKARPEIRLFLILPCKGHYIKWKYHDIESFWLLWDKADYKVCCQENYSISGMLRRDRFLVDYSRYCAYYKAGSFSHGTKYTVDYAVSRGRKLINVMQSKEEEDLQLSFDL